MSTLEQEIVTAKYQSIVGSLLWLAYDTRPELCVSRRQKKPPSGHYDAARYVLKYIFDTADHSLQFTDKPNTVIVNFIGFVPPLHTTFSDANC
jgi:hypothetical protein